MVVYVLQCVPCSDCYFYWCNIVINILNSNSEIDGNKQSEIIHIIKAVTEHNYFQFEQQYYKQMDYRWVFQLPQY
jgi:hypothetical protein